MKLKVTFDICIQTGAEESIYIIKTGFLAKWRGLFTTSVVDEFVILREHCDVLNVETNKLVLKFESLFLSHVFWRLNVYGFFLFFFFMLVIKLLCC